MTGVKTISISKKVLDIVIAAFYKHTNQFKPSKANREDPIAMKLNHTARVAKNTALIAKTEGLTDSELNFAMALGWLHDIGRFEQWAKYNTFVDGDSENHAKIAIRNITETGIINLFTPVQAEVVCKAILNHNIPKVSANEGATIAFYSKMLRDADKLDIYNITIEKNYLFKPKAEKLPDCYQISSEIYNCFKENTIVHIGLVRNPYDVYLFRLSWVFDITFKYAFEQILTLNIPERILEKLPNFSEKEKVSNLVQQFLEMKIQKAALDTAV